jgi:pyruvate kinase
MINRRTKIVCTIGPASNSPDTIDALITAGMDVARLNFSHGTHDDHARAIGYIREASRPAPQGRGHPRRPLRPEDPRGAARHARAGHHPGEELVLVAGDGPRPRRGPHPLRHPRERPAWRAT